MDQKISKSASARNQNRPKPAAPLKRAALKKTPNVNIQALRNSLLNEIRARPYLSGRGELSVAPVIQGRVNRTTRQQMRTLPNGDCLIRHREYLQDITANGSGPPTTFSDTQVSINPGVSSSFPWLSAIAQRFESYQFKRLRFDYETEAPSSLGGTVILAVDYDASDPAPLSKQQALAFRNSVRAPAWKECSHDSSIEDLSKQKSYFVRSAAPPASADIKLYDVGTLNVITQGVSTASATCGELYVDYEVLLMTPVLESFNQSVSAFVASSTVANPIPSTAVVAGNLGISGSGTTITMTGLVIGSEYLFLGGGASGGTSGFDLGTFSGATAKTTMTVSGTNCGNTFTADASTVTAVLTVGSTFTNCFYILQQVPTESV